MSDLQFDGGSFRDRTARVFYANGRVLRALSQQAVREWRAISGQPFYQHLVSNGEVIPSHELTADETSEITAPAWAETVLEHQRLSFVSYPYEWSFAMLREAAQLHLRILQSSVSQGFILKDASSYNVQFVGPRPIFIDVASFIAHRPGDPWAGYRQFCEMLLVPLLLQAYRRIDFQPLLRSELEGIPAMQARRWFGLRDLFKPGIFTHVWLHGWLQHMMQPRTQEPLRQSLENSGFSIAMIERNLQRLERLISGLRWKPPESSWTQYDDVQPHVARDREQKSAFVREVCESRRRDLIWDLGCNRGHYSKIAAAFATTVVAMDQDHGCIEKLYLELRQNGPDNVLPLKVNLANPSPALGWEGRERLRLEDRGRPDLVICLGLSHHLIIGGNLPIRAVVDWLGGLGGELIIEFATKEDPLVQQLLANKPDQYEDYSLSGFRNHLQRQFHIKRCEALPSGERFLIYAIPRNENGAE